jgi:Protein of unknown function (DUF5818)
MKKANLLVMLVALGVIAWAVPATNVHAVTHSTVLAAQQDAPAPPSAQENESKTFTGKIANQDGKYTLQGEDGKTYQLDDQDKAKQFDGKSVKVTGTLDEESMTIHVSEIEEAEA